MEVITAAASLMALVLGALAIWLAVQYYVGSRTTERDASQALSGIKAQTQTLEKISDRFDHLSRTTSVSHAIDENLQTLAASMAGLPATMFSHLQVLTRTGGEGFDREALAADLINCYIELYYYTGLTNLVAQALLPGREVFDVKRVEHRAVQGIVDRSATDFAYMTNVLRQVDDRRLEMSPYHDLLDQAQDHFRLVVSNSQATFEVRARQPRAVATQSGATAT